MFLQNSQRKIEEEFLKLTKKNLKRFFPESFQERKVEIMEVLKNNNIKLQGV